MPELRQDPVTRDWVIINAQRAKRPEDADQTDSAARAACPFCPGRESATPADLDRIDDGKGRWLVRAVPNKYPALESRPDADMAHAQTIEGWYRLAGWGRHEVIIETPEHETSLGAMPVAQVRRVLEMYMRRYRALADEDARLRQIVLFRNQGRRAGTSLTHPHAQIVATPAVAPETRQQMAAEVAFFDSTGHCGRCHVLARELASGVRVVHVSERFATVAPYASRMPYQMQVIPRRHCPAFREATAAELDDLAAHLVRVLAALRRLNDPDHNLVVFDAPLDQVHRSANHWFIELLPRLTTPAGFELGSRIVVNVQTPEQAAAELRARLEADGGA